MNSKILLFLLTFSILTTMQAQDKMTPELLWKLNRVNPIGISDDGTSLLYSVTSYEVEKGDKTTKKYSLNLSNLSKIEIENTDSYFTDKSISPDKTKKIEIKKVKIEKVLGTDLYPNLKNSDVKIYNDLDYRHWDEWNDGTYNHLILSLTNSSEVQGIDIMKDEPYYSPQMPFGGDEDFTWNPDGTKIIYVSKKLKGKEYALSTNTDLYEYDVKSGKTENLTKGMMGYDTNPQFSKKGTLAFLSMARDGYEADKNDIIILKNSSKINLTKDWDGTVNSFLWDQTGDKIYFTAPIGGTVQLFSVEIDKPKVQQITNGDFDVVGIVGQANEKLIVTRTDMNHAQEIYSVELSDGKMVQITDENKEIYQKIKPSKTEKRIVKTTDNKDMVVWVIYPPDFDPKKKYPTLLYCQGGPQSALTQFYSYRWNFQLIAAQGYIVVAPNRRGMPGHGVKWNEDISKDWGGQPMKDYLSAIDDVSKENYVDKKRLGAVGASYGGYSVFYLAGHHDKRFKTFIAHDGVFDLKSMYGTTEELWFTNWDGGGAYWEKDNPAAMKTYQEFDPSNYVANWDTPILIIQGGRDYRVPIGQGLEAFQAAQLHHLKSRLLYFPDENHWVLNPQNSIIWHTEFFKWLQETL